MEENRLNRYGDPLYARQTPSSSIASTGLRDEEGIAETPPDCADRYRKSGDAAPITLGKSRRSLERRWA